MTSKTRLSWILALVGIMGFAVATALASPAPVGSLMGSKNATLDGQAPLPNTVLLSGDNLRVNDGLAMVTLDQGNRMVLGSNTDASFLKEASGVTVSMTRGNMSLFHPEASKAFRVKVGDVTVMPTQGFRTMGEIAMVNGLLVVRAKDGALQVEKSGTTKKVIKGQTITIATTANRAPTPVPPGREHMKHVALTTALIGIGATAVTLGIIEATLPDHRHPAASPVRP